MMRTTEQQSKVSEAFLKIQYALTNIQTNEEWQRYLIFQGRFHNYSFSNVILIYLQIPDAQYVAGYNAWHDMNRYVKRGSKAIQILAPIKKKVNSNEFSDMSKEEKEKQQPEYLVVSFRVASVFDISQTGGDDSQLPVLVRGLSNQSFDAAITFEKLKTLFSDVSVTMVYKMATKGSYNKETHEIKVRKSLTDTQKVKTLIHEFAHHLHHSRYFEDEDYSLGEIIAESSAYVVTDYLGFDTSEYSIPYVQSWSNGDLNRVKSVGHKVQKIADEIINLMQAEKQPPHESDE